MKKLKIAVIAPLWVPVPPESFGGTEIVVSNLVEELVKKGHKVTLFASGESKTSAKLKSFIDVSICAQRNKGKKLLFDPRGKLYYDLGNHLKAFTEQEKFDVIHSHLGKVAIFFSSLLKVPLVVTQHIPFPGKGRQDLFKCFRDYNKHTYFIPISCNQVNVAEYKIAKIQPRIFNGINVNRHKFNLSPKDYFVFLGRIMPEKGTLEAVKAISKVKGKLKIAGSVGNKKYFERVKKYIDGKNIKYIKEVKFREKNILLKNAKALLFPIDWEEPFGLVMTEAMACGTPVIAFKRGSVSEVVKHGKTGFIVPPLNKKGKTNIEGLVEAIKKIDQIDRKECRRHVEENFTVKKMVDEYEKVYYKIIEDYKKKKRE
ncbi:MAG: glycosyltransferase family 4 protein [Thermoplasmata archaeon]|nr:MAG: glycosyltransferase family 4 protein [Thermoplasmata archaeon]